MKKQTTPHFDVSILSRLQQAEEARMKLLGYEQYRVYDIEESKQLTKTPMYGIKRGDLTYFGSSKSYYIIDDWARLYRGTVQNFKIKWLKPKHVTFLKLKGHRIEQVT
jgi:hypothetical protein